MFGPFFLGGVLLIYELYLSPIPWKYIMPKLSNLTWQQQKKKKKNSTDIDCKPV